MSDSDGKHPRPTGFARWAGLGRFLMRRSVPRNAATLGLFLDGLLLGMLAYALIALLAA